MAQWVVVGTIRLRSPQPLCSPFCPRCNRRWDQFTEWVQFLNWAASMEAPTKKTTYSYKEFVRPAFDFSTV